MPYPCHNHPPRSTARWPVLRAQAGWTEDGRAIWVEHQPHWRDGDCYYVEAKADPRCEGCRWRTGEPATPFELRGFLPGMQFHAPGRIGVWMLAHDDGTGAPLFRLVDGKVEVYLALEDLEPIGGRE